MERLSIDEVIGQLKYMYKTCMNEKCKHKGQCDLCCESKDMAIQALEEIQQYRAIGTVEELIKTQIREKVLNAELESYKEIGTIEEFKAFKVENEELHCEIQAINATMDLLENEIRAKAIDEFAEKLKKLYQAYDIDLCLQDNYHLNYTNSRIALESYIDEIKEQLKAGGEDGNK